MDVHGFGYYEPPPDYSDSSDDERLCQSLNPMQVRNIQQRRATNYHELNLILAQQQQHVQQQAQKPRQVVHLEETSNEIQEIVVPNALNNVQIPRSNWTLQKSPPDSEHEQQQQTYIQPTMYSQHQKKQMQPVQSRASFTTGSKSQQQRQVQAPSALFQQIRARMQTQAGNTSTGPGHNVGMTATIPPPPPPPPPGTKPGRYQFQIPPQIGFKNRGLTPSPTASKDSAPKPLPRRTMSVKSTTGSCGFMQPEAMKPLINEFRFYQKTQKSILGQKSELQKAIEKRQQALKVKQLEEDRTRKAKTPLEKILEMRALKIADGNENDNVREEVKGKPMPSLSLNNQKIAVNNERKSVVITVNSIKSNSVTLPANNNNNAINQQQPQQHSDGHVKLILKSIEQKNSQNHSHSNQNSSNNKFCKRLDFPSAGSPWSPSTNYVR